MQDMTFKSQNIAIIISFDLFSLNLSSATDYIHIFTSSVEKNKQKSFLKCLLDSEIVDIEQQQWRLQSNSRQFVQEELFSSLSIKAFLCKSSKVV